MIGIRLCPVSAFRLSLHESNMSASSSSVGQLESAALKRKAKLAELRAKKLKSQGGANAETTPTLEIAPPLPK